MCDNFLERSLLEFRTPWGASPSDYKRHATRVSALRLTRRGMGFPGLTTGTALTARFTRALGTGGSCGAAFGLLGSSAAALCARASLLRWHRQWSWLHESGALKPLCLLVGRARQLRFHHQRLMGGKIRRGGERCMESGHGRRYEVGKKWWPTWASSSDAGRAVESPC